MGTSHSVSELALKLGDAGTRIPAATLRGITAAAVAGKTTILTTAAANKVPATGLIAGRKWGVRYAITTGQQPSALLEVTGAFPLVEQDTKRHDIKPKQRPRKTTRKQALAFDGIVRASVHHPGTKGKRIFAKSKVTIQKTAPAIIAKEEHAELVKVFH